jgi:protein-tyrosine phosphatase
MGTVHGVYLKYVGLSAISYAGYTFFARDAEGEAVPISTVLSAIGARSALPVRALFSLGSNPVLLENSQRLSFWRSVSALVFGYSSVLNGVLAVLFKMEIFMGMIGKNRKTGQIPRWSYVLFFPFHIPTRLYTFVHTKVSTYKVKRPDGSTAVEVVPVASECQPGWWVGGCYAHELNKEWAAIIDLTVEFPETCFNHTKAYLSIPTWDGVPATPAQLEAAAFFAVTEKAAHDNGDVLVHCAHGRGRSTTVMCACLVKAGLYPNWEEAFEKGIKPGRSVCKLNKRMKQNLTEWQRVYVDSKKVM